MSIHEYKEALKKLVDSMDNELLLRQWKKQLEWDVDHQDQVALSEDELNLVNEGLAQYERGEVISLEDFLKSRKS